MDGDDVVAADVMERSDVVIVGGGIAGLAMARALARKSIRSLVVERRGGNDDGLAVNLPGNAIAALAALGLGDDLQRYGRPTGRREYRAESGRLLFAVDENAFWGNEMRPRCLRRRDLLAMLGKDQTAGSIRHDVAVAGISDHREGATVTLSDGSTIGVGLLIGADGVHSTVRKAIFGGRQPDAARLAAASWRFMVPNPGVDCWTVWAGKNAMLLLIPVDGDQAYVWAAATRSHATSTDLALLTSSTRGFPEPARKAVEAAQSGASLIHHSPLEEVRLARWSSGHVLLVGDAAHATAPVWAQGAALAMEDALVLADLLGQAPGGTNVSETFEARRRARVDHVQAMTDRMSKAANLPNGVRNMLLPFVGPRSYKATYEPLKAAVA